MNAMNSTPIKQPAGESAAPLVAAKPAVMAAPADASGAAAAAKSGPLVGAQLPGFAQALAAQLPSLSDAEQASACLAGGLTDLLPPSALALPVLDAAGPAEMSALANGDGEDQPSASMAPLDFNGLATLAAVLLWPAGLPAAGVAATVSTEATGVEAQRALADRGVALTTLPNAPVRANVQESRAPTESLAQPAAFLEPLAPAEAASAEQFSALAGSANAEIETAAADGAAPALRSEGQGGMALPLNSQRLAPLIDGQVPAGATTLSLKGESHQWQQPLLQALGDRLQLQIAGRSEQAVIRLSPPMLGQVEIAIRQQAGELQVRLSASHGEVTRQLQQVSESLRHELVQRHSGEVTVQVSASGRDSDARAGVGRDSPAQQHAAQQERQGQQQQQGEQQRRPGRALQEAGRADGRFSNDMTPLASSV